MKDPIGSFETIKENFIRYVKTAFGTKFDGIEKERYDLLNYDKVLYRKPWIEPLPDYVSSGKKIEDLTLEDLGNALNESEANTFKGLVNTGLIGNFPLHSHQAEMLKQTLLGNNCIITSGTGSGKTESFLLPLFAQLSKELANWTLPNQKSASINTWWHENGGLSARQIVNTSNFTLSDIVRQRQHETRKAGVRALILYPMNALVEDQMSRLRKALDSDDTREWLSKNTNGNAIYFGRYNGSSPVAGELKKIKEDRTFAIKTNKVNQLKEQLQQIETDSIRVEQYIQQTGKTGHEAKDLKSFFQRLDGAEMRSRFDMQVAPPDILITNYSMLSIMLMRDIDKGIFDETKQWLEESKNNIFHLIIDELHLYRGTQGTEIAYLLKLVLNRLGLNPHHPQLRILASSASLEAGDDASKNFVCDFFGVSHEYFNQKFKIIEGRNNPIAAFPDNGKKLPISSFKQIAEMFSIANGNIANENFIATCDESATLLATTFNLPQQGSGISKLLSVAINPGLQLKERLFSPCYDYKAVCSSQAIGDDDNGKYFAETIFEKTTNKDDLEKALRGLLIARAMLDEPEFKTISDKIPDDRKLPRFRFHYFFRNIEGIWASVKPEDIDEEYTDEERTAGKLYSNTRINSEKGNRVLELLYCDNCGTTLFGGSRLVTRNESGNNSFEMLPISPNIEGIPEKTPAKLVERRSYQEFAVFWPIGNQRFTPHDAAQGIPQNCWRQPTLNGFNQVDFEANWIPASLNSISGDIDFSHSKANELPENWIKGYYFTITNSSNRDIAFDIFNSDITVETHKALPSVCPNCGINHQKRQQRFDKNKTSSIRGFRTGFAKTTQMFAKELMYQLPNKEDERKLVVFSDSREDAAQIANGIERNHFTDLMREILVKELHSNLMFRYKILNAFDNGDIILQQELKNQSQTIFDEIEYLVENSNYSGTNANRLREKEIANSKLSEIRSLTLNVRGLVHITNTLDLAPLIKHFISIGINPGGNDISLQTRLLNGNFVPWYELIDFKNFQWANGANQEYIDELKEGSFNGLASIFFGSLFYSFESSALGFICMNPELQIISDQASRVALAKDDFLQILNSTIRILGDKYKHNKVDDDNIPFNPPILAYTSFPEQVKKYIRAIANRFSKPENEIGEAIYNTLSTSNLLRGDSGIQIENLFIKVARQTDSIWTSQRGSRPHLHFSGGICTHSFTALQKQSDKICDDIWKENYLSFNAIKQQRPPIRLHCEELTGQTDNQFERQRHFRNIILPDEGNRQVKTIDLLSVTTTLEVGVDIGALQAVMLGNMPPQRFNYQQRVGRAGRRGQAYSVILTFCRGRSHDEFYFANPRKITGDAPPTPFLTMGQERIFRRLLAKEILRRAYVEKEIDIASDDKSSVHGEFGSVESWAVYKHEISNWINENSIIIEQTVDALLTPQLQDKKYEFLNWISDTTTPNGFIERAESIINNEEIASNDISEKFAEGGVLPMFGMPTTVKNLYHGINRKPEALSIDRAQAMAIYEFAPGAQKTKDKAIHQVIGFTSDFINTRRNGFPTLTNVETTNQLPFSLNRWFVRCRACGFFETYSEDRKAELETQNQFDACPNCGEDNPNKYQPPFKLKSPRAYRTNLSAGNDTKDDSEFLLSRPPIFAEKIGSASEETISNASISISDNDVTWRVNTNSDRFFSGRLFNTNNCFPFNANGYRFNNQWLLNDFAKNVHYENGYSMSIQQIATSADEQIALASNKNTEIFRIAPTNVPYELDLNMFFSETDLPHVKAQSNGVRSGYYSAAFLLQRILADKLDVDPTEIEIADISMKELYDGRKIAEIILTDELQNGSGFVRYLYNNLANILSESIIPSNANSYLGKIHSQTHQGKCDDACYDCLKVFRNMNYHSLLDWRLGLSMLRVMNDSTFFCGADGNFNFVELQNWFTSATDLRNSFAQSFGFSNTDEINGLPIIKFGRNQRNVIMIVHPFWNMRNFTEANWLAEIYNEIKEHTESNKGKISIIDTFNLHRRPGWCYEKLIER
jgi:DEAD/DEAH box helicase domain-containing protein